jgi:hypothetical protein
MFTNFIKKLAYRDYINSSEFYFDFTSGGERNVNVQVVNYDLSGNIRNEHGIDATMADIEFWVYGANMVVWLAQILDHVATRRSDALFEKTNSVFNVLFNQNQKYDLSAALSLVDSETKRTVIEKHATVQFKIVPATKNTIVAVTNVPVTEDILCQTYLFAILFDYFCKNHPATHMLSRDSCALLINEITSRDYPESKPFQIAAYEITNAVAAGLLDVANKH